MQHPETAHTHTRARTHTHTGTASLVWRPSQDLRRIRNAQDIAPHPRWWWWWWWWWLGGGIVLPLPTHQLKKWGLGASGESHHIRPQMMCTLCSSFCCSLLGTKTWGPKTPGDGGCSVHGPLPYPAFTENEVMGPRSIAMPGEGGLFEPVSQTPTSK